MSPSFYKRILKWIAEFFLFFLLVIVVTFFVVSTPESNPQKPNLVNDITQLNPIQVAAIRQPKTLEEISSLVKNHPGIISIGGGRFSMGGQTATEKALQLDMREFNKVVNFSKEKKEITVQTGMTWRQLQDYIDPHNLSLKIMQTYSNFTVGGSLSVNVHGRYIGLGPIIYAVKNIKLVLADGSIVSASPTENSELFYGAIGGYGALGVIAEATLSLADNIKIERITKRMPIREYKSFFMNQIRNDSSVIFHNADVYLDEIKAISYVKTNKELTVKQRLRPMDKNYRIEKFAMWVVSELPFGSWFRQQVLDPIFNGDGEVEWRNYEASYNAKELEPSSRKDYTYVLQEYFIPVEKVDSFIPRMHEIIKRHGVNIINVSIRHAHKDPGSMMAWAKSEVFAFVIYYKQGTSLVDKNAVAVWTRELIDVANSMNGSYYLPYQIVGTKEQFKKAYPNTASFFALKKKVDPDYKFRNKLWDAYYQADSTKNIPDSAISTPRFSMLFNSVGKSDSMFLFLQNVYGLYPSSAYLELIKKSARQYKTDKEIYEGIQKGLPEIKPFIWSFRYALPALKAQKKEIADQTVKLIGTEKTINGYLEIGSTGRYVNSLQDRLKIEGPVYLSYYEHPSYGIQDMMERGQIFKIGTFFDLNKYDPISTVSMPDSCVELVTLYIGLHHCPHEKLDAYVKSIYRVLRPGGKLIIRDHNVNNKSFNDFVSLIHDVFYCGLGETWDYTNSEIRNFTSSDTLQNYLEARGFKGDKQRLLQPHDPSENTLMCFTRLTSNEINSTVNIELDTINGWKRDEGQTYLTLPEWYLVYSPDEYARFIKASKPSTFPYFGVSKQFWDYYSDVNKLTKDKYEFNWGYHFMLWVIGTSYTVENVVKGAYEKTVGRISEFLAGDQRTEEDEFAALVAKDYVSFIRVDPWYLFPFSTYLKRLWTETDFLGKGFIRKLERKVILSNEYAIKAAYAYLIKLGTQQVYGTADATMLVQIEKINDTILKKHSAVTLVKTLSDSSKVIGLPRYEKFRDELISLLNDGARVKKIAGNNEILLSYVSEKNLKHSLDGAEIVIDRPLLTSSDFHRKGMKVSVKKLQHVVKYLKKEKIVIEHIYDY